MFICKNNYLNYKQKHNVVKKAPNFNKQTNKTTQNSVNEKKLYK